jgi:hypothetical protein
VLAIGVSLGGDMERKPFQIDITGVEVGAAQDDYLPVTLATSCGMIAYRHYQAAGARCGAIFVSGVGGGFGTPARGLYPQLCRALARRSIAALWVRFRHPTILEESILDVLAGSAYLRDTGIDTLALIGWSFGGAVVIQAAAQAEHVRTVVTLATQSYGVAPVAQLGPRCSILLLHGTGDERLPALCSEYTYSLANEPKWLMYYDGAGHALNEVVAEVRQVVGDWLVEQLNAAQP